MAKIKYPPQGGEKRLCLTLFCTMMLSVISAVGVIYCIVIVYIPAKVELESNLQGPKMCTTLTKKGPLGEKECTKEGTEEAWSSCEEWCLSVSSKSCSHIHASVREMGTQIWFEDCDMESESYIDEKCNTMDDIETFNCKIFAYETDKDGNVGDKSKCIKFDQMQIYCTAGICKNVSSVYKCDFQDSLRDISGLGASHHGYGQYGLCNCRNCDPSRPQLKGYTADKCTTDMEVCGSVPMDSWNSTMTRMCKDQPCFDCKDVCHSKGECFDMLSRRDPTLIGVDDFGLPSDRYYNCVQGYCSEIYDLKCERKCNDVDFDTKNKNTFIFNGESIIMAQCNARSTAKASRLEGPRGRDTLMVACSNVTRDNESKSIIALDCLNGTWFENDYNGGSTNYSYLTKDYAREREIDTYRTLEIDYEMDITIFNVSKLKINIQGCVNTLMKECDAFYSNYSGDGRNYTSRAVYPCWYDPENPDFAVIQFDPKMTLFYLLLFACVPCGIMLVSCLYMCLCSKFIHVADDGHMRLRCCGKYVTGIGNVPRWDPPSKKIIIQDD